MLRVLVGPTSLMTWSPTIWTKSSIEGAAELKADDFVRVVGGHADAVTVRPPDVVKLGRDVRSSHMPPSVVVTVSLRAGCRAACACPATSRFRTVMPSSLRLRMDARR